jgi:hypothetical protein
MKLTPAHVAALRAVENVRGQIGVAVLYAAAVKHATFARAQELTALGDATDVVWYFTGGDAARVTLVTNWPEWFAELELRIEEARGG